MIDLNKKTEIELDFILLNEKIFAKQSEITTLKRELYDLQNNNFDEIYVGKFWKQDFISDIETVYSYCKRRSPNHQYGIYGIFDYFKIVIHDNGFRTISFKKNFEDSVSSMCKTEITREEYEQALEEFKNSYLDFMDMSRKILIEKKITL